MTVALERDLVAQADPRYVTPLGDRRERAVPCVGCSRPTLAIRGPLCVRCHVGDDPYPCSRCGADMGDDAHDDGDVQVCDDCCSCKVSEQALPVSDDGGVKGTHPAVTFSDAPPALGALDGGDVPAYPPGPVDVTATTAENDPAAVAAARGL